MYVIQFIEQMLKVVVCKEDILTSLVQTMEWTSLFKSVVYIMHTTGLLSGNYTMFMLSWAHTKYLYS